MPTAKAKSSIYQLKITFLGIDPTIWRRIQVPSTIPLCCLHDAFQAVFGWTDSHLHQFGACRMTTDVTAILRSLTKAGCRLAVF